MPTESPRHNLFRLTKSSTIPGAPARVLEVFQDHQGRYEMRVHANGKVARIPMKSREANRAIFHMRRAGETGKGQATFESLYAKE